MSMYNELRANKKNNNSIKNKELIKNQKFVNLINLILCLTMILADILYIIKGNIVGVNSFNNTFMIISLILEILMLVILAIPRFNTGSIILKLTSIVIFTLPIIAYASMFKLDGYNILIFIFRLLLAAALVLEIFRGSKYQTGRGFIIKCIIAFSLILAILIPSIIYVASNRSRNIIYSYDNNLGGYCLDNVLSGSAPININDNTIKIGDESLKNSSNELILPSSVKEVSNNAFVGSNVKDLHISSSEIKIVEALNNSNIERIYLDSSDINILDIDKVKDDAEYKFIASKENIDAFRAKHINNQSMFIPKTSDNEYYVILNNTTSKILYFNKGDKFYEPSVSYTGSQEVKLLGFNYTNNKNIKAVFPIIVNDNIELSASWSKVYTFKFDYNGGNLVSDDPLFNDMPVEIKRIREDGNIQLPILEKTNYYFDGWYDSDVYNDNDDINDIRFIDYININIFNTTSYKAHFSKKYMIDYHVNGGYIPDNGEEEIFIEGQANTPKTPERLGYNFLGWYSNPELTGEKINVVYKEGVSLYAKWDLMAPTISLSKDINKVYDGNSRELLATIDHPLINESSFNYTIDWYKEGNDGIISNIVKNAENSKYYCVINITHMGNRKTIESERISVDIEKANFDLTGIEYKESYSYEFNGKAQYPTFDNLPDGLNVKYEFDENEIKDVGDNGMVMAIFSTNSNNYNVPESLSTYVYIEKKKVEIIWDKLTFEYTGSDIKPQGVINGVIEGYPVNIILDNINTYLIAEYKLDVAISDITHYELNNKDKEVTYEIVKANYDLSNLEFENTIFTYNGEYQYPIPTNLPDGLSLDINNISGLKDVCQNKNIELKFINNNPNYNNPLPINVSITINKKLLSAKLDTNIFTYNGKVQVPSVTLTGAYENDLVMAKVANDSINVGQYTSKITLINGYNYDLDDESKNLVYFIQKANYDLSDLKFETTTFTYDGNKHYPVPNNLPDGVEISKYESIVDPINCGNYEIKIKFSGDPTNYNYLDDLSVKIEIVKADYDLSKLEYETNTFTYNKKPHYPMPNNLPSGLNLDINNINGLINVCENSDVTLKFINTNNNYNDPEAINVKMTIIPKEIKVTLDNSSFVYKPDTIQVPTVSVTGEIAGDSINVLVINNSINAGTYVAQFKLDNDNYIVSSEYNNQEYVISKANYNLSNLEYEKTIFTYDKKYHYPIPSNLPDTLDLDTTNSDRIKDVCSNKEIILKFINNDKTNYNDPDEVKVTITIKPCEISASLIDTSFVYNGEKQTPFVQLDGVIEGDLVFGNILNDSINAGEYSAIIELTNNNYILNNESNNLVYTISKANYDLSNLEYDNKVFTYNRNYQYPNPLNLPSGLVLDTENTKGLIDVCNDSDVTLKFINNDKINYNNPNDINVKITINPYEIEAILGNDILVYNNKVLVPSVTLNGIIDGDDVYANVVNNSIDAGRYIADIELNSNNYVLNEASKNLSYEIFKANFDYKYIVDDATYTYDGKAHSPYVSTVAKYTEHQKLITYSFSELPVKSGNYDIIITFSVDNNYNDQYVTKNLTILKKDLELEFDTLTTTYNGQLFVPQVTGYIGLIEGDDVSVSVANSNTVEVGEYPIILNCSGNDINNYNVKDDYKISIYGQIKTLDNVTVIDYNAEYDGKYHTVSVEGLPEGVTPHFDKEFKDVVTDAEVNITFSSSDPNIGYSTVAIGYVTITKKEVEVSFDTTTLTYNGEIQAPTPIVIGALEGDNVGVTFDAESINVSVYSNINFVLNNPNYKLADSTSTILSYEIVACHVDLEWGNTSFTYNGEAQKPTAIVKHNGEVLGVNVEVSTDKNTINAGTYTATASLDDANYVIEGLASTEFVIAAKGLTLNWGTKEFIYNGKNQYPQASVNTINGDNCDVNVTVEGEHKAPGSYIASAKLSNPNYKINGNNTLEYKITKGSLNEELSGDIVASATTLTYDGTKKLPTIDETNRFASDASLIKYRLDEDYISAGTYNVDVIFYTDNGYYNEYLVNVQLIIKKLELDLTFDSLEFGFNNNILKPTVISINNKVAGDDLAVEVTNVNSTIGTYTAIFEISGSSANNYQITKEYNYSIVKGTIDMSGVEVEDSSLTYDGTKKLPIVNNLPNGVSIDYDNSIGLINVGTAEATIKFKLDSNLSSNYNVPSAIEATIKIVPRTITYNVTTYTFGYDGLRHLPLYTLSDVISGDVVELVFGDNGNINRGQYVVAITGLNNSNYVIDNNQELEIEYEITAGTYDMSNIVVANKEITYDGKIHNKSIEVNGGLPNGVEVKEYVYSADPINAGSYSVTIKFTGDSINYNPIDDITYENILVITPKTLTLSWDNKEFTYDKQSHIPTATISSGLVDGDTCNVTVEGEKVNAGTYNAIASIDNSNYQISNNEIEFVINPIEINVNASMDSVLGPNFTFNFDGIIHNNLVPVYDADSILEGDELNIRVNTSNIKAIVGEYAYTFVLSNSNYHTDNYGIISIKKTTINGSDLIWVEKAGNLPYATYNINNNVVNMNDLSDYVKYNYYTYTYRWMENTYKLVEGELENGKYVVSLVSLDESNINIYYYNIYGYKEITYTKLDLSERFSFDGTYNSNLFVAKGEAKTGNATFTDGNEFSKFIKLESGSGSVSFEISEAMTMTLYVTNGTSVTITKDDGDPSKIEYTSNTPLVVELEAGSYVITKGEKVTNLYAIFLEY